jgi:hypothetical protein
METWKEIALILISTGALIMALYCLLFMVPVKRFLARVRSLGGGVKGMEALVEGIHEDVCRRLSELEASVQDQIGHARESSQQTVERLAKDTRQARRDLERLRGDLQSLQAELRTTASGGANAAQSVEELAKRLQQFQGDFDQLDVKLRESVRTLVADSFRGVESTVLTALDGLQQEMLAERPRGATPARTFVPRRRPSRPAPEFGGNGTPHPETIIEPLFAGLNAGGRDKGENAEEDADEAGDESDQE